jgi:mannosyl-oligosaccharide alpha-1,2-mannosidase
MFSIPRRWAFTSVTLIFTVIALWKSLSWRDSPAQPAPFRDWTLPVQSTVWSSYKEHFPVKSLRKLPSGRPRKIPKIQHQFVAESSEAKEERLKKLAEVKESMEHTWESYRSYAFGKDEISPLSGGTKTTYAGWAATLVDSLDTLWIMGFYDYFDEAVNAVAKLDFSKPQQDVLNVFETTIRYLGGLLSAYDLSEKEILLAKAVELGDMLYVAFDTKDRVPVARWNWSSSLAGEIQEPNEWIIVAETGSLSLEFTRLSQLTGDPKYYDAISRITDIFHTQQTKTRLPGLWPISFAGKTADTTTGDQFSLGAMADSLFEYLPKEFILLGGLQSDYREMYESVIRIAKSSLFFRPMVPDNKDILISGIAKVTQTGGLLLVPEGQHLACFVGGMVAISAKIFDLDDLDTARKLVDGCIWAYQSMPSGIMPEVFSTVPCGSRHCKWDEAIWKQEALRLYEDKSELLEADIASGGLPSGFTSVKDKLYQLRPEAIESVFILYRITGDSSLQEKGWEMFQAINKHTKADFGHATLLDVTTSNPEMADKTESFWTAETLKYFYLLFSEPDLISLDNYVFNTEAHPFKRPT